MTGISKGLCVFALAFTGDGGATWQTAWSRNIPRDALSPTGFSVRLLDHQHGYAWFGLQRPGDSLLLLTGDGGRTWQQMPAPAPGLDVDGATFLDARHGWVVGRRCDGDACTYTVYHTVDGGGSWRPQLTVTSGMRRNGGAFSFVDADHGWLLLGSEGARCGMHGCRGLLYRTADGGQTWGLVNWTSADHRPL